MNIFYVENSNSTGPGSFNQAIINANNSTIPNPTIQFTTQLTINLSETLTMIDNVMVINGNNSVLSGQGYVRHMWILTATNVGSVVINDLTFRDGYANNTSAAVLINRSNVIFNNIKFINNRLSIDSNASPLRGCCIVANESNWTVQINSTYEGGTVFSDNIIECSFNGNVSASIVRLNNYTLLANQSSESNFPILFNNNRIIKSSSSNNTFQSLLIYCSNINASNIVATNNFNSNLLNSTYNDFITITAAGTNRLTNCTFDSNGSTEVNINGIVSTTIADAIINLQDCKFNANKGTCIRSAGIINLNSTIDDEMTFSNNEKSYTIISNRQIVVNASSKQILFLNNYGGISIAGSNNIIRFCKFTSDSGGLLSKALNITNSTNINSCIFEDISNAASVITTVPSTSVNFNVELINSEFSNVSCSTAIVDIAIGNLRVGSLNFNNCTSELGVINVINSIDYLSSLIKSTISTGTCSIINCTGTTCAGLRIVNKRPSMDLDLSNFTIENNTGIVSCGIYLDGITYNINDTIELNVNNNIGGNFYLVNSTINMVNINSSTISSDNTVSHVYIDESSTFNMTNCKVTDESTLTTNNSISISNIGVANIIACDITCNDSNIINNNGAMMISYSSVRSNNMNNNVIVNSSLADVSEINIENSLITGGNNGIINSSITKIFNSTITRCNNAINNDILSIDSIIDIINSTISHNLEYAMILSGTMNVGNTIISNSGESNINGVALSFNSLGGNCIDDNSGLSIFTQSSDMNNTNPLLESLTNNGGLTDTYALLYVSPCINSGVLDIVVGMYDQRGEGYNRVYDNMVDIGAYEHQGGVVCFKPDSLVTVLEDDNELISINPMYKYSKAKFIYPGDMIVTYDKDGNNSCSERVIKNVITGPKSTFIKICKNEISPNVPFEDVYFTGGHMLVINGCEVKARDLISRGYGMKVVVKSYVHTIVLRNRSYIKVNGILNVAFGIDEWNDISKKYFTYN